MTRIRPIGLWLTLVCGSLSLQGCLRFGFSGVTTGTDSGVPDSRLDTFADQALAKHDPCGINGWCWEKPGLGASPLEDLFRQDDQTIFAVGGTGTLLQFDGTMWTRRTPPSSANYYGIDGLRSGELFIAASESLLHFVDGQWEITSLPGLEFRDVYVTDTGDGETRAYAVGGIDGPADDSLIYEYRGGTWTPVLQVPATGILAAIDGRGPSDIYAVGRSGFIFHYDGQTWTELPGPTGSPFPLYAVWVDPTSGAMFIAGADQKLFRWQDQGWTDFSPVIDCPGCLHDLVSISGDSPGDLFILTADGRGYRYQDGVVSIHPSFGTKLATLFTAAIGSVGQSITIVNGFGNLIHWDGADWRDHRGGESSRVIGLTGFDDGSTPMVVGAAGNRLFLRVNEQWSEEEIPNSGLLSLRIWGTSLNDLWVTGASLLDGIVMHRSGSTWTERTPPGTQSFSSDVWGTSSQNVYVSGRNGVWRWDGLTWTMLLSFPFGQGACSETFSHTVTAITGDAQGLVFAVGADAQDIAGDCVFEKGAIWSCDTSSCAPYTVTAQPLITIWGDGAGNYMAGGLDNHSVRFDVDGNGSWIEQPLLPPVARQVGFVAIAGSSRDELYAATDGALVLSYDGTDWTPEATIYRGALGSIWLSPDRKLYVGTVGGGVMVKDLNP